jgi:hypothetical protein
MVTVKLERLKGNTYIATLKEAQRNLVWKRHLIELLEHSRHTVAFQGSRSLDSFRHPRLPGQPRPVPHAMERDGCGKRLSTEWFERDPSLSMVGLLNSCSPSMPSAFNRPPRAGKNGDQGLS